LSLQLIFPCYILLRSWTIQIQYTYCKPSSDLIIITWTSSNNKLLMKQYFCSTSNYILSFLLCIHCKCWRRCMTLSYSSNCKRNFDLNLCNFYFHCGINI
jgi:hypothetical protein